jgi:hypothetical protein
MHNAGFYICFRLLRPISFMLSHFKFLSISSNLRICLPDFLFVLQLVSLSLINV